MMNCHSLSKISKHRSMMFLAGSIHIPKLLLELCVVHHRLQIQFFTLKKIDDGSDGFVSLILKFLATYLLQLHHE